MRIWPAVTALTVVFMVVSCRTPTPPRNVTVVNNFNVKRFTGKWYEVARFDHRFESGLTQVTATYSPMDDGGLRVINRGFNPDSQKWQQSEGKAYFIGPSSVAALKVSFFGPFYGGYNVIALDKDYRHALICGPNRNYLWILSRSPEMSETSKRQLLDIARRQGFPVEKLVWVKQSGS